jgi:hypothetical protein
LLILQPGRIAPRRGRHPSQPSLSLGPPFCLLNLLTAAYTTSRHTRNEDSVFILPVNLPYRPWKALDSSLTRAALSLLCLGPSLCRLRAIWIVCLGFKLGRQDTHPAPPLSFPHSIRPSSLEGLVELFALGGQTLVVLDLSAALEPNPRAENDRHRTRKPSSPCPLARKASIEPPDTQSRTLALARRRGRAATIHFTALGAISHIQAFEQAVHIEIPNIPSSPQRGRGGRGGATSQLSQSTLLDRAALRSKKSKKKKARTRLSPGLGLEPYLAPRASKHLEKVVAADRAYGYWTHATSSDVA